MSDNNQKSESPAKENRSNSKNSTFFEKVKQVNQLLESQEPKSVSHDSYSGYTGYAPQYVIDAMNAVFGVGGWGFEEIQTHTIGQEKEEKLAVTQVKVWLEGCPFTPTGWGQSRITRGDIGDGKKGAQTDAIKKALSYFSVGSKAYRGLLNGGKK